MAEAARTRGAERRARRRREAWRDRVRGLRGLLAALAMPSAALAALVTGCFAACGEVRFFENVMTVDFWCALAVIPVSAAAFPPLSRRLRRAPQRWALLPLVPAAALYVVRYAPLVAVVGAWFAVALAATTVCVVYVAVRVLPGERERASEATIGA